jgi:hypothetical protein
MQPTVTIAPVESNAPTANTATIATIAPIKTFKLKYFLAQNTIKMKREVRRIHCYTAEKEKTNDTKVIKDQTCCIFFIINSLYRAICQIERFVNNTISLDSQRQRP